MPVVQLTVTGIATGCLYALIALGFSVVYRNTRTINLAQGDFLMVAGYVAAWASASLGLGLALGALVGVVAVGALSAGVERVAFRPLYRHPSGVVLVIASSIGLVFVLETAMLLIWGPEARVPPPLANGSASFLGASITWERLLIVGCLVLLVVVLERFLRTRVGVGMRAAAERPATALLLGVEPRRMATLSYAMGGALTAIAGVLAAPITLLTPTGGAVLGLFGLISAIVGGLGNVTGAVVGGLILGLVNAFGSYQLGGTSTEALMFGVLVLVFIVRPRGLFGEEGTVERV